MKNAYALLFVIPSIAQALSPATSEQLLCFSTAIVTAKVTDAAPPTRCNPSSEYSHSSCSEPQNIILSVQVAKVIGDNNEDSKFLPIEDLRSGKELELYVRANNALPLEVAGILSKHEENGGINIDPPTGELLTKAQVTKAFVGKEFIFSINSMEKNRTGPLWAFVWRLDHEEWVYSTLHGTNPRRYGGQCPKPV